MTTDAAARLFFATPRVYGIFDEFNLAYLDPADEDDRSILIAAEHPEMHDSIKTASTQMVDGKVVNPSLHLAIHQVVTNQFHLNDPPEMWETAKRLIAAGYERHEIFHMLASVVCNGLHETLAHQRAYDIERVRKELKELPASWEAEREASSAGSSHIDEQGTPHNRAQRRAAARRTHHH